MYAFTLQGLSVSLVLSVPVAAQTLGPKTLLPGDTAPHVAAGLQQRPVWATGDGEFLVVWEDARSALGEFGERPPTTSSLSLFKTDLLAARFDAAGTQIDAAPIVVSGMPWIQRFAQVAWNGESYLVVWQAEVSSALTYSNAIFAARISGDGVLLDDPAILIEDSIDADEMEPAVASDGDGWVVTWQDFDPATGVLSVRGATLSSAGTVLQKKTLGSSTSGFFAPRNARLAWAQDRYLVTWDYFGPSGEQRNLFGRFFDATLSPLGTEFEIAGGAGNQADAAVTSNGTQFFVAWGGFFRASPVLLDGTVVVPGGLPFAAGTPAYGWTPSVVWDGTAYLVSWLGATMQGYSIYAARMDTSGAILPGYPKLVDSGLTFAADPVVGGANGVGLVAWHDTRMADWNDVWGVALDAAGTQGATFPISICAPTQTHVDLDGNVQDGYLLAFVRRVSGEEAVQVQRVDGSGAPIDSAPTTLVSDVPNRLTRTAVAHGPSGWLVVWENIGLQRTQGMRVGLDGSVLDATPIDIVAGNTPDVAFLGGEFLVVTSHSPFDDVRVVRIRRVRASDGALLGGEQSVGSGYSVEPTVEAFSDRWLIAYEGHPTHDSPYSSIGGVFVLADGTAQPAMTIASQSFATLRAPAIGAAGATALVTWGDGEDLRGGRILSSGTLLDGSTGFPLGTAPSEQRLPAAGWDGSRWTVAYTDYRVHAPLDPGVGDAYVTTVEPDGTRADLLGTPLANHPNRAEGGTAVGADGGTSIAAYVAFQSHAPYGTLRVELRRVSGSLGSPYCFGDGSGTLCPCGNDGAAGEGCASSAGTGALLTADGSASLAADDLVLRAAQLPAQMPALLFVGTQSLGSGAIFGDGLQCAGGTIRRLGVMAGSATGTAAWGPGLSASGGWLPGDTRYLQVWYRDPIGPCGTGYNLSHGLAVAFEL